MMARWQIMKDGAPLAVDLFDDGELGTPGDEGFSTDAVREHVANLGDEADGFNYVGASERV